MGECKLKMEIEGWRVDVGVKMKNWEVEFGVKFEVAEWRLQSGDSRVKVRDSAHQVEDRYPEMLSDLLSLFFQI